MFSVQINVRHLIFQRSARNFYRCSRLLCGLGFRAVSLRLRWWARRWLFWLTRLLIQAHPTGANLQQRSRRGTRMHLWKELCNMPHMLIFSKMTMQQFLVLSVQLLKKASVKFNHLSLQRPSMSRHFDWTTKTGAHPPFFIQAHYNTHTHICVIIYDDNDDAYDVRFGLQRKRRSNALSFCLPRYNCNTPQHLSAATIPPIYVLWSTSVQN